MLQQHLLDYCQKETTRFPVQAKLSKPSLLKVCSVNSVSFSLIRLGGYVV